MSISVDVSGDIRFERIQRVFDRLQNPSERKRLLNLIGGEVEAQTRERLSIDKTAPDGSRWEAWSEDYAKTRHGNQSLLESSGDLIGSIQYLVKGGKVHIGSPLPYAAVHQDGFNGSVNVSAHTRTITQAFGRALKFPVHQSVGAFTKQVNIPQRQYLGLSSDNEKQLLRLISRHFDDL